MGLDEVRSGVCAAVVRFHPARLERELGLAFVCCFGWGSILLERGTLPGKDGVDAGLGGPYDVVQVANKHTSHRVDLCLGSVMV